MRRYDQLFAETDLILRVIHSIAILSCLFLTPPGRHAFGDFPAGPATGTRKGEGAREGEDGIISAKKRSHKQVFPFTKRGGEEELLCFVGNKKK